MVDLSAVGDKVTGLDVAIASLVLLSRIASNGAKGRSRETSVHDRRSVCIQCIACNGSCLFSMSWPRRTASEEKSTFCQRQQHQSTAKISLGSRTYNDAIASPASRHECVAESRSQFRYTRAQMEYSWCRVLFWFGFWVGCGSVLQEREECIKQDFAWVQPFPDVLAGRELRVPEGRVVIVGGAGSFGPRWVRSHSLGKCEDGGSKKIVFVASRSQCSRKQHPTAKRQDDLTLSAIVFS